MCITNIYYHIFLTKKLFFPQMLLYTLYYKQKVLGLYYKVKINKKNNFKILKAALRPGNILSGNVANV